MIAQTYIIVLKEEKAQGRVKKVSKTNSVGDGRTLFTLNPSLDSYNSWEAGPKLNGPSQGFFLKQST